MSTACRQANAAAVLGTLAREAEFTRTSLSTTYAGLNKRIRFKDTGNRTGYETATDLWLLGVEYDFGRDEIRVTCGTMSGGGFSVDAYRQKFAEKTRLDVLKQQRRRLEELYNCLQDHLSGGVGAVGSDSPRSTPGCRVAITDGAGNEESLQDFVDDVSWGNCSITYTARNCMGVQCATIVNEANFDTNPAGIKSVFDAAASQSLTTLLCKLATHVANLWTTFGSIAVSHDIELSKTLVDIANIRTAGWALANASRTTSTRSARRSMRWTTGLIASLRGSIPR